MHTMHAGYQNRPQKRREKKPQLNARKVEEKVHTDVNQRTPLRQGSTADTEEHLTPHQK